VVTKRRPVQSSDARGPERSSRSGSEPNKKKLEVDNAEAQYRSHNW
jgi:hypothetical protein